MAKYAFSPNNRVHTHAHAHTRAPQSAEMLQVKAHFLFLRAAVDFTMLYRQAC